MKRTIYRLVLMLTVMVMMTGCGAHPEETEPADQQNNTEEQVTEMSIPIDTVKTDSFEMDYFKFGTGSKALVIIPGLSVQSVMGSADAVADAYKMFAEDYTVYLFDRRKDLPETYSVYDMAADTAAAMGELGLEKTDMFGASQGGMIAMDIAIEHPELVNKLILASTSARINDSQYAGVDEWIQLAKGGKAEDLYLSFAEKVYTQETFEQFKDTFISMAGTVTDEELDHFVIVAEGLKGFDVLDSLDKIECPVLVTGSEDDNVLGAEATKQIAEKLEGKPGFQMHMYDGYGHAAYDMAPDYKERMKEFLGV